MVTPLLHYVLIAYLNAVHNQAALPVRQLASAFTHAFRCFARAACSSCIRTCFCEKLPLRACFSLALSDFLRLPESKSLSIFVDDVCVLQAMAEGAVAPFTLPLTLLHSNTHTRVVLLQQGHAGDHLPNKTERAASAASQPVQPRSQGQTDGRTALDCRVAEAAQPNGQTLPADSTGVCDTIIKQKIG